MMWFCILGFNLEKLLEEEKLNPSPPPEHMIIEHEHECTVKQTVNQFSSDHSYHSQPPDGSKTHSIIKQSSRTLPQVYVKDTNSKISIVSIPVGSEDQGNVAKAKLSPRKPKTKGWAPKLITKTTVIPKEVCTV